MVNVMLVFTVALVLSLCCSVEAQPHRVRPSAQEYAQFFTRWMTSRNAAYSADVLQRRFQAFKDNLDLVEDHNERFRAGLSSFTMALNQWADLTEGEYRQKLGFVDLDESSLAASNPPAANPSAADPAPIMLGDPISDALCRRFGIMCRSSSTAAPRSSSSSSSTGVRSSSSSSSGRSSSSSSSTGVRSSSSSSTGVRSSSSSSTGVRSSSSSSTGVRSSSSSSTGVRSSSSSSTGVRSSSSSSTGVRSSSSSSSSTGRSSSSSSSTRSSSTGPVVNPLPPASSTAGASSSAPGVISSTGAPPAGATTVDWRQYGYINPVKDQKQCGSCWAFASASSMEAAWAIKTGQRLSFSEQELLDCAANGARTCNTGGNMQDSWNWLINGNTRRSPMSSASYPYTANSDAGCLYNASRATNAVFASRVYVQANEAALLTASRTVPSIAVAIHASGRAFQFYSSGVLSDSSCLSTNLDHAVNVVGFGTDAATGFDYWLVRNSWSNGWGENGYVKIRRNFNNMCGIATQPTYITA